MTFKTIWNRAEELLNKEAAAASGSGGTSSVRGEGFGIPLREPKAASVTNPVLGPMGAAHVNNAKYRQLTSKGTAVPSAGEIAKAKMGRKDKQDKKRWEAGAKMNLYPLTGKKGK